MIAAAAPASAQGYNPFQIGAAGGIAFPTGDLGNVTNTGYNISVMVGYKPQFTPIGVRAEAAYNQFGSQIFNGNVNIPAFTGNLVFGLPMGMLSPYAIGGAGLYRTNVDVNGGGTGGDNHFGFNIGFSPVFLPPGPKRVACLSCLGKKKSSFLATAPR